MIWLNLFVTTGVLVLAILNHFLQYKWHDKRTAKHGIFRKLVFFVLIILGIANICLVYLDQVNDKNSQQSIIDLTKKFDDESKQAKDFREKNTLLMSQIQPFLQEAQKRFPNEAPDEALKKLGNEVAELKNTIRDFQIQVEMTFSGEWSDGFEDGGEVLANLPGTVVSFVHSGNDRSKDIRFVPTSIKSVADVSKGTKKVSILADVLPGQYPLGNAIYELTNYNRGEFLVVMIDRTELKNPVIYLERVTYYVFVNGVQKIFLSQDPQFPITLFEKKDNTIWMDIPDIFAEARR
ncbi:MAG: hypothetical protein KBD53_08250 [Candidatus Omnitrophica bacterium]|nr:hypothetical protein [Candidatus Omnitrophota bacterium]